MTMTATELRDILDELGWSQGDLARLAGRDHRLTRRMAAGQEPIDDALAKWLLAIQRANEPVLEIVNNPPPRPERMTT